MKRFSVLMVTLLLLFFCVGAQAASFKLQNLEVTGLDYAVAYSFDASEQSYIYLKYKTAEQTGSMMLTGEDGHFEGTIPLELTYPGTTVTLNFFTAAMSELASVKTATKLVEGDGTPGVPKEGGALNGVTVCIDPGHQGNFVASTEPLGPGLSGTVTNTPGSAIGVLTYRREHIVTLEISLLLKQRLLEAGANVVMTREIADTNLTNIDRCDIANEANADYFLRLHCNQNDSQSVTGIWIYAPKNSDYAKALCDEETYTAWAQTILDEMLATTGVTRSGVALKDRYVGNNWSKMPTFLIEMGYMSSPKEDILLATPSYQEKLVEGMVNGIINLSRQRGLIE